MTIISREEKLRLNAYKQGLIAHKGKAVYGVSGWMLTDFNIIIVGGLLPWTLYALELDEAEDYIGDKEHEDIAP